MDYSLCHGNSNRGEEWEGSGFSEKQGLTVQLCLWETSSNLSQGHKLANQSNWIFECLRHLPVTPPSVTKLVHSLRFLHVTYQCVVIHS